MADLSQIRADGKDLCFVSAEPRDGEGNLNPKSNDLVRFEIEGPGTIQAVAIADPTSTESYKQPPRKAYRGRALVIVRSSREAGEIKLTANVDRLPSSEITIAAIANYR